MNAAMGLFFVRLKISTFYSGTGGNEGTLKSVPVGGTLTISAQNRTIGTNLGLKMHIYVILVPNLCKSLPVELFEQFLEHPKSRTIPCVGEQG